MAKMDMQRLSPQFCAAAMHADLPKRYFILLEDVTLFEINVPPPDNAAETLCRKFMRTLYPDLPEETFDQIYSELMWRFTNDASPCNFLILGPRGPESWYQQVWLVYIIDNDRSAPDPFSGNGMTLDPRLLASPDGDRIAHGISVQEGIGERIITAYQSVTHDAPFPKLLKGQEKTIARPSRRWAQVEAEMNELRMRKADVRVLERELAALFDQGHQGEDEDAAEIGAEITRLSAIKGQHLRRIRELEMTPPLPSAALANELQKRRQDVQMIRAELEALRSEEEDKDNDVYELGQEFARLSALKGQHERRIREIENTSKGVVSTDDDDDNKLIADAIQWLWDHGVRSQFAVLHIMMAAIDDARPISLTDGVLAWKRHMLEVERVDNAIHVSERPNTPAAASDVMFLLAVQRSLLTTTTHRTRNENFIDGLVNASDEVSVFTETALLFASAEQVGRGSTMAFDVRHVPSIIGVSAAGNITFRYRLYDHEDVSLIWPHLHPMTLRHLGENLKREFNIVGVPFRKEYGNEERFSSQRSTMLVFVGLWLLSDSHTQAMREFLAIVIAHLTGLEVDVLKDAFLNPESKEPYFRMLLDTAVAKNYRLGVLRLTNKFRDSRAQLNLEAALSRPAIEQPQESSSNAERKQRRYDLSPKRTRKERSRSRSPRSFSD